ncbi:hypothetical protein QM414_10555, partial [Streptococcus mitis]|uniref:hypothetical protein n=1 Tax=Streptococcus mitis TaxID=28037 RepID=UPI0039C2B867
YLWPITSSNTIRERLKIKKLEFRYWKSLAFLWLRTILSQVLFLELFSFCHYFDGIDLIICFFNIESNLTKAFVHHIIK